MAEAKQKRQFPMHHAPCTMQRFKVCFHPVNNSRCHSLFPASPNTAPKSSKLTLIVYTNGVSCSDTKISNSNSHVTSHLDALNLSLEQKDSHFTDYMGTTSVSISSFLVFAVDRLLTCSVHRSPSQHHRHSSIARRMISLQQKYQNDY
jgi:hypothetical protein